MRSVVTLLLLLGASSANRVPELFNAVSAAATTASATSEASEVALSVSPPPPPAAATVPVEEEPVHDVVDEWRANMMKSLTRGSWETAGEEVRKELLVGLRGSGARGGGRGRAARAQRAHPPVLRQGDQSDGDESMASEAADQNDGGSVESSAEGNVLPAAAQPVQPATLDEVDPPVRRPQSLPVSLGPSKGQIDDDASVSAQLAAWSGRGRKQKPAPSGGSDETHFSLRPSDLVSLDLVSGDMSWLSQGQGQGQQAPPIDALAADDVTGSEPFAFDMLDRYTAPDGVHDEADADFHVHGAPRGAALALADRKETKEERRRRKGRRL